MKIAVLVGSLRKESFNRKTANILTQVGPKDWTYNFVSIGDLPFYNEDLEANAPSQWKRFREEIKVSDAILIVSPEYNRCIPAALKNAIDVGSRPYNEKVWPHKPTAVVTVSLGATGGMSCNHQLRQALLAMNMPTLLQPEMYIGKAGEMFDEGGNLKNDKTRAFFTTFMQAFEDWVKKFSSRQ